MIKSAIEIFSELPDPRREHPNKLHNLTDIVIIAISAVIAKCETWEEIADYGEIKEGFFKRFLDLSNGIPSHDTFNRVFRLLNPEAWQNCFINWMTTVNALGKEKLIAIDGKMLRASKATGDGKQEGKQAALTIVSAWASENQLVLAQLALEGGAHELTVIPELLDTLDLEGASVSIDAAGCYQEIANQIINKGGNYLLSLKGNQGLLFAESNWIFNYNLTESIPMDTAKSFDVAHGREEQRTCYLIKDFNYLATAKCGFEDWQDLKAIIVVESEVLRRGKKRKKRRFFLTSHNYTAKQALSRVRSHWSIENQQHYPLDILFSEDACRTRKGYAAQNLATLRRLALNLLNLDTSCAISKRRKRLKAILDDNYLLHLLGLGSLV